MNSKPCRVWCRFADGLSRNDDDVLENLLGQIPMLRGGTASDVSGRKERGHKNPSVVENAFRTERIDRCRNIGAGPDPAAANLARAILQGALPLRCAKRRAPSSHRKCG